MKSIPLLSLTLLLISYSILGWNLANTQVSLLLYLLVIASIFLINSEEKDKYSDADQANDVDYDGMGNYGRFPQKN